MSQAISKLVSFEDFAAWRPEGGRYELHDGAIVEMAQPVGDDEDIVGFLALEIGKLLIDSESSQPSCSLPVALSITARVS